MLLLCTWVMMACVAPMDAWNIQEYGIHMAFSVIVPLSKYLWTEMYGGGSVCEGGICSWQAWHRSTHL